MIDFASLNGRWTGSVRTFLDPKGAPVGSEISGLFRSAPGGGSTIFEYTSSVGENVSNGVMMIGRNIETGRYSLAWVDSFHTGGGLMLFDSKDGSFHGAYAAGSEVWRWRITFAVADGRLQIDHFNISPDGHEDPAIEIRSGSPSRRL